MSICGLDFTPYNTRRSAQAAANLNSKAFAVTQISNDTKWWYYLTYEDGVYRIHFKDGEYIVPSTNNATFDQLRARTTSFEKTHNPDSYITESELVNNFIDPTTVKPKIVAANIKSLKTVS